ncbi:MAG: DUF4861 family protein [Opitutaceae bacterium]
MKTPRPVLSLAVLLSLASPSHASERVTITVTQPLDIARPGEVVSVPWKEIALRLPGARPEKLLIRDGSGASQPYQFTNFHPDNRKGLYDDVLFQHDFAPGEKRAVFTIESLPLPALPFPARVFARYVPERYDDFAWENDHIAHRIYGQALDSPAAGGSRLKSSGIDVWAKRVRYPIVDRWYIRGHDNYHKDNGEGFDFYSVGTGRGCGGSGIWDGRALHTSHNWSTWRVYANGPLRAIFELTYAPWDAGNGVSVSEVKRFTVDAGRNLDEMESTFTFSGPAELTVAFGLGKHPRARMSFTSEPGAGWASEWEEYPEPAASGLGTGIVFPAGTLSGMAEDDLNHLALVKVRSGQTIRYYTGAGWVHSGDFAGEADWRAYLAAFSARLSAPLSVAVN